MDFNGESIVIGVYSYDGTSGTNRFVQIKDGAFLFREGGFGTTIIDTVTPL